MKSQDMEVLFDSKFLFELKEGDTQIPLEDLTLKYPTIPKSIVECEYIRLLYAASKSCQDDVCEEDGKIPDTAALSTHLQNSLGWLDERKAYLTSSSIANIIPSTLEIAETYRRLVSKSKQIEDLSNPKKVTGVKKRIRKYIIDKIEGNGIGANCYLRWGDRFEKVAKHLLQHHIGLAHPILDVNLQRHRNEACLATSLDGDIPSLDAVAEFKCIYYTTNFYKNIDWKYYEQIQSQMDATNRSKGYWLMCQFDSFTLGSVPNDINDWKLKLSNNSNVGNLSNLQNGIFLKDIEHYETYLYPPIHLETPEQFWSWMKEVMDSKPPRTYYPVFWKLKQYNLLVIPRDPMWLEKRKQVMRAVMRMITYYKAPENLNDWLIYRDGNDDV
ncbi:MAG: hypothetical protein EOP45_04120 [Sphingobacteriaceae bacterium]|nr:MAG: hypothetical protein EOP45_04120 [Sphingobacteriaceae bacterium]